MFDGESLKEVNGETQQMSQLKRFQEISTTHFETPLSSSSLGWSETET